MNYTLDENKNLVNILGVVYPVGSIYMSVNSTNPSTLFGGTWEKLENRFLLGAGSSYSLGATGGETSHKLSAAEMPSHNHSFSATGTGTTSEAGNHNHSYQRHPADPDTSGSSGQNYADVTWETGYTGYAGLHTHSFSVGVSGTTGSTGSGSAHNNMPPYLVVNIWKRTA